MNDALEKVAQPLKLYSLQAARGIASIAIIFWHAATMLRQPKYGGHVTFHNYEWVALGLNFFFVLSGFIIFMVHYKDIGKPEAAGRYLYRRTTRIYPIYWIYLTLYIIAAAVGFGYPDFSWDIPQLLNAYGLSFFVDGQGTDPLPLKVAWTMFFEVQFYFLFLILILNRTAGIAAFGAWLLAMVYFYKPDGLNLEFTQKYTFFSLWNVHFLCGMLAYLAFKKLPHKLWSIILAAGASLVGWFVYVRLMQESVSIGEVENIHFLQNRMLPVLAPGFGLIVLGLVMAEKAGAFKVPKFLSFLGDASYSIYLVHSAFISVVLTVFYKIGIYDYVSAKLVYFFLVAASTAAGCVCYLVIEKPLLAVFAKKKPLTMLSRAGKVATSQ